MKKLLLTTALFISLGVNAQQFTRHYDYVVARDKVTHTLGEIKSTDIKVFFSGDDKGDIIISGNNLEGRYYKKGSIYDGVSKDGFRYRYIETRNEKNEKVIMQLFDDIGVFRVHTQDATFEYKEIGN